MRQGPPQNGRRARGRHHGGNGGNGGHNSGGGPRPGMDNRPRSAASLRHQTFDSNCNDMRVRGNAWQVHEKYQALARDAQSSGDRVAAENFLQHAEHYFRIIEAINEATAQEQRQNQNRMPQQGGSFGSQPDVPVNYYGGDNGGQPAGQDGAGQPDNAGNMAQPPQAQAEVAVRQPPQGSPFFTPDEIEAHEGTQSMVARR